MSTTDQWERPRAQRLDALDSWRGVACLTVAVFHSSFYFAEQAAGSWMAPIATVFQRLWLGVPIFFVISGYCIAAAADNAGRRPERGERWWSYTRRRLRRIFPPYYALVALAALLWLITDGWLVPGLMSDGLHPIHSPASLSSLQWMGNVTLTETWRELVVAASPRRLMLGHAWTLCYEEQFYAIMGLVVLVAPRRIFAASLAVTALVGGAILYTLLGGMHFTGLLLDGRWFLFAPGILLYWARNYATSRQQRTVVPVLISTAIMSLHSNARILDVRATREQEILVAACFALVLWVTTRHPEGGARAAASGPLASIGAMCYSMYLVHWPIVKVVTHAAVLAGITAPFLTLVAVIPAAIGASLASAWLFHVHVERRFLNAPSVPRPATQVQQRLIAAVGAGAGR